MMRPLLIFMSACLILGIGIAWAASPSSETIVQDAVLRPPAFELPINLTPNILTQPPSAKQKSGSFLTSLSRKKVEGAEIMLRLPNAPHVEISDIDMRKSGILLRAWGGEGRYLVERVRSLDAAYPTKLGPGLIRIGNGDYSGSIFRDLIGHGSEIGHGDNNVRAVVQLVGKDADDRADGFVIERFDFRGGRVEGARFNNFDGISYERGYANGLIRNGYISDFSDACIDAQGVNGTIERVYGEKCSYFAKIWSSARLNDVTSGQQRVAHFRIVGRGGETVRVHFGGRLTITDATAPLFWCDSERGEIEVVVDWLVAPSDIRLVRRGNCNLSIVRQSTVRLQ